MLRNKYLLFVLGIGFFILFWQGSVTLLRISTRILPDPLMVLQAFLGNWKLLLEHSGTTILEALAGLGVSIVLGVFLAIVIDASDRVRHFFAPLLVFSQTIPLIALAPILLLWFGFGIFPKVVIVVLYCFFPITLALIEGLKSPREDDLYLLKSMRATRWQILTIVKIPASMPFFLAGLQIAAVYAVAAAIIGEFVGGYNGLGILMLQAVGSHRVDLLFAVIIFSSLISCVFYASVVIFRRLIFRFETRGE